MMSAEGKDLYFRKLNARCLFSLFILFAFFITILSEIILVTPMNMTEPTNNDFLTLGEDRRLMSLNRSNEKVDPLYPLSYPCFESPLPKNSCTYFQPNELNSVDNLSRSTEPNFPSFQLTSNPDLNITSISPEAMQKDAISMTFTLNLTIQGKEGLEINIIENVSLSNNTHDFKISLASAIWTELQNETGSYIDKYILIFDLNGSFLSSLEYGSYDLIMYVEVDGYKSYDSISLPMKDLEIIVISITPNEFNNKLDSDQDFNVTIQVREYVSNSSYLTIEVLPQILDEYGNNTNPSAEIEPGSGELTLIGFISNTSSQGLYTLNYRLSPSIAQTFLDGDYNLVISVISSEGVVDEGSSTFTAKGTVYLVYFDEIIIESYSPLDYDQLMADSIEDIVTIRLNVNDSIIISFQVKDEEQDQNSTQVHDIGYQDPINPEDPTAIKFSQTNDQGYGSIILTVNEITPTSGYSLLFFVRGHRTSQETDRPSNITIYWDLLMYDYAYYDKNERGTSIDPDPRALWVDVNESWVFELNLYYASDGSNAFGSNISYRFGGIGVWTYLLDGLNGDALDGLFNISKINIKAEVVLFECSIISGALTETLFVNKTAISAYFSLNVTWTYLLITMKSGEPDARLTTLTPTYISFNVSWAHSSILLFEGTLTIYDHFWDIPRDIILSQGVGTLSGLVNVNPGIYRYSVLSANDDANGKAKFSNTTIIDIENPQVQIDIIWDEIEFTYSNTYNSSLPPDHEDQTWGIESFKENFGDNATLYIYGWHSYDITPFNGTAILFDFISGANYSIIFLDGIGIWIGNLTEAGLPVTFSVMEISVETRYGVLGVATIEEVEITWDKIVIILEANLTRSHGTWADIYVKYEYLISDDLVDPRNVSYSIRLANGTLRENVNWTHFRDYSIGVASSTYQILTIYDVSSGLTKAEARYKWSDLGRTGSGDLTIYWIDDKVPTILELITYDLGNGTIIIIVDVTDDSELWMGSGVFSVELFDEREEYRNIVPQDPIHIVLPSGVHRYYFKCSYNEEEISFPFEFRDSLIFSLIITDKGTMDFPAVLENLRLPNSLHTAPFIIENLLDIYKPEFILMDDVYIKVEFPNLDNPLLDITKFTDGTVFVTVRIHDKQWSGINRSAIILFVTNLGTNETDFYYMIENSVYSFENGTLEFFYDLVLVVGDQYQITVTIADDAGNTNTQSIKTVIEDKIAPRVTDISFKELDDRQLEIIITLIETGFGIDYVKVAISIFNGEYSDWIYLTEQGFSGGSASAIFQSEVIFSGVISLAFNIREILEPKIYNVRLIVSDLNGNIKEYLPDELSSIWSLDASGSFEPLIFHPLVLLIGAFLLLVGIVFGIRVASRTVGYDMKRILNEGEKVPREVILTLMDEYALGVTINFFDQVQGPVPVIWEPSLLEDQQQVMLDLSDKSFSTLEFVDIGEAERSGTFDFSTGSYDCTALGYSFAIENPQARGGKENLTVVLLLRKEWGDNLLVFQDELVEKLREIKEMIVKQNSASVIEQKARELREFVSRIMLAFNKIYSKVDYTIETQVE